ncbi:MAG: zinc ribbon domain-containing protein [Bacteroidota bacterium]
MNLCSNCAAEIIPGSRFCNRCGDKIADRTKECPVCTHKGPVSSVFCHHCGYHFEGQRHKCESSLFEPRYSINFKGSASLTEQVKALFFKQLRKRVEEEHDPRKYADYVERFYQSRFREIYELRSQQIADDIGRFWLQFGSEGLPEIDIRLETAFEGLLDYLIIQFCTDLNGVLLPSAILNYEKVNPGRTDLWKMIRDFMDFEFEDEAFYFDFIGMRSDLLANACRSFLAADAKERVYFICDLSLRGNCKEGFAMTNKALYWKSVLDKPRMVSYSDLENVRVEKEWITVNGHFFNANRSLNLKMCKLLKKLKGWKTAETEFTGQQTRQQQSR